MLHSALSEPSCHTCSARPCHLRLCFCFTPAYLDLEFPFMLQWKYISTLISLLKTLFSPHELNTLRQGRVTSYEQGVRALVSVLQRHQKLPLRKLAGPASPLLEHTETLFKQLRFLSQRPPNNNVTSFQQNHEVVPTISFLNLSPNSGPRDLRNGALLW